MRTASEKAETSWNVGEGIRQGFRKTNQDAADQEKRGDFIARFGFTGQSGGVHSILNDDVDCLVSMVTSKVVGYGTNGCYRTLLLASDGPVPLQSCCRVSFQ